MNPCARVVTASEGHCLLCLKNGVLCTFLILVVNSYWTPNQKSQLLHTEPLHQLSLGLRTHSALQKSKLRLFMLLLLSQLLTACFTHTRAQFPILKTCSGAGGGCKLVECSPTCVRPHTLQHRNNKRKKPLIRPTGRLRQEDHIFKATLSNSVRPCHKLQHKKD